MTASSVITIGNFDGVHRGHQAILDVAKRLASERDARVLAITFEPTPIMVLRPEVGPPRLASIDQRVEALRRFGADEVVVINPTPQILQQEATPFIASLVERHNAVGFVEGEDFHFGKERGGDMQLLASLGQEQGFAVESLPRVEVPLSDWSTAPISSSLVRWLIGRGRVEDATVCLGRPFELCGKIVQGEQRGRTIGIPTANLDPESWQGQIVPMDGVYAGLVTLEDDPATAHRAAISVGLKPTFDQDQLTIEAHLIGLQTDHPDALYGKTARFAFARWVRDQYPFPGIEALIEQLRRDIDAAYALMAEHDSTYD